MQSFIYRVMYCVDSCLLQNCIVILFWWHLSTHILSCFLHKSLCVGVCHMSSPLDSQSLPCDHILQVISLAAHTSSVIDKLVYLSRHLRDEVTWCLHSFTEYRKSLLILQIIHLRIHLHKSQSLFKQSLHNLTFVHLT